MPNVRNPEMTQMLKGDFQSALGTAQAVYYTGGNGGTATSGAWRQYPLNALWDNTCGATIGSNNLYLKMGVYAVNWWAVGYYVSRFQTYLWNSQDGLVRYGVSRYPYAVSTAYNEAISIGHALMSLNATRYVRLYYRCQVTAATYGLGVDSQFGTNVFGGIWVYQLESY
jgi:hypothetical protein